MAWSLDRLGRSLQHLLALLEAKRVDLYLDRQGVDTTTPGGRALFQMMGVFAEFERAMIQERVKTGLARAKLGRPQISTRKEQAIRSAKAEGLSIRQIAARCGVSVGTVHNVLKGYPAKSSTPGAAFAPKASLNHSSCRYQDDNRLD